MDEERPSMMKRLTRSQFRASHIPSVTVLAVFSLLVICFCSAAPSQAEVTAGAEATSSASPLQADAIYENYRLRNGSSIDKLRLHYVTLGSPHRNASGDIDNAVLVLHWTGNSGMSLLTPEYMKSLYGAGQPLDAGRYYLIIPDNLGHGQSSKPSDGLRTRFPQYGYDDIVDVQHRLVSETLGIKRLHAILGMSMGGMNAWQWAEAFPDEVEAIMPVVALPVPVSGRNLLWRRLVIDEIRHDPDWQRGDRSKLPVGFTQGYELLQMMIEGVPHLQMMITNTEAAETYIASIDELHKHADVDDFLYSLESSQDYDPSKDLSNIKAKVYALNFSDDAFNPDELQILENSMKAVKNGRYVIQQGSAASYGHLTMAHPSLWASHVHEFMAWAASHGQ
jgi:homoserine O-acetyltransferase/O-succinyltransferase